MAARLKITAEMRSDLRKSHTKAIRREGMIPATVYGSKIEGSVSVQVPLTELTAAVKEQGANVIIDLSLQDDGKGRTLPVMLHELKRDPRTRRVLHVDFRSIALDVKTNATVPVHLVGTAIGVTEEGADHQLHSELTVSALPTGRSPQRSRWIFPACGSATASAWAISSWRRRRLWDTRTSLSSCAARSLSWLPPKKGKPGRKARKPLPKAA